VDRICLGMWVYARGKKPSDNRPELLTNGREASIEKILGERKMRLLDVISEKGRGPGHTEGCLREKEEESNAQNEGENA